ncbi:uncharacterized protein LOC103712319 [Phoenix dactylifera]|uniref:Uncharacterized protein LOC103712319 n=1 Tax=Phoenix dactylifera TaxID=42345 RepID=A0A8B8J7C6_PHODC|nr:uncharacterized protein LOC103712319 [Phoenix dactylifera]
MSVHPAPKKRNITFRYDVGAALSAAEVVVLGRQKKLRRLPHIFSKVLELPLAADADVAIHEGPDDFRFVAAAGDLAGGTFRAYAVRIHPGVMKVVVRGDGPAGSGGDAGRDLDDLELDRWRFRLPPCTRPALAIASCVDGELVVTVPKAKDPDEEEGEEEDGGEAELWGQQEKGDLRGNGGISRLVFVQ